MGLFSKFIAKVSGKSSALAEDWQELERALIEADLGPKLSSEIINQAKDTNPLEVFEAEYLGKFIEGKGR